MSGQKKDLPCCSKCPSFLWCRSRFFRSEGSETVRAHSSSRQPSGPSQEAVCCRSGTGSSWASRQRNSENSVCRSLSYWGPYSAGNTSFGSRKLWLQTVSSRHIYNNPFTFYENAVYTKNNDFFFKNLLPFLTLQHVSTTTLSCCFYFVKVFFINSLQRSCLTVKKSRFFSGSSSKARIDSTKFSFTTSSSDSTS